MNIQNGALGMMEQYAALKTYYRTANRDLEFADRNARWQQLVTNLHADTTPAGIAHRQVADQISENATVKNEVLTYLEPQV
jgi:hypothetical protein